MDTGSLQCCDLRFGVTLASRDDSTGVAHTTARRGGLSSKKADEWQVDCVLALKKVTASSSASPSISSIIIKSSVYGSFKLRQHIDKIGSIKEVTTDADKNGLAQSVSGGLIDSFIGESA